MQLSIDSSSLLDQLSEQKNCLVGLKVLVLDSDPDTQALHQHFLESYKITVFTASSVHQALHLVQVHHPQVVISNLRLAGEESSSLMQQIRQLGIWQNQLDGSNRWTIPVGLAIDTNHPWPCCPVNSTGYQWYLSKPFCLNELIATLHLITEEFVV